MVIEQTRPEPPTNDKRWKLVQATMRRHGYQPNALIETLHTVQETFGYLEKDGLRYIATSLRVPRSRVFGVATFYQFFTLKPQGKHICVMCLGTACYIKGSPELLADIEKTAQVTAGETSSDGLISLQTARCLGSCGLAPAAVFDGEVVGRLTPAQVHQRVEGWKHNDS
jgi:bidirectional [NiFe] hydrogenase diaphorase subunit